MSCCNRKYLHKWNQTDWQLGALHQMISIWSNTTSQWTIYPCMYQTQYSSHIITQNIKWELLPNLTVERVAAVFTDSEGANRQRGLLYKYLSFLAVSTSLFYFTCFFTLYLILFLRFSCLFLFLVIHTVHTVVSINWIWKFLLTVNWSLMLRLI